MDALRLFTLRSLLKNKTRTIVTIVGIILSVAMFTATTEAFVTVQNYLVSYAEMYNGKYHVGFYDVTNEDAALITEDERVEKYTYFQDIGYADIGSSNKYKPYLYIAGMPSDFTDIMPVHLTSGRLPENSSEIVLSDHLYSNGGVKLSLGEIITLEVGERKLTEVTDQTSRTLTQKTPFIEAVDDVPSEGLINTTEKTYTVVGFCVRPDYSIESYYAPGYTAFTINEQGNENGISIFSVLKNPSDFDHYHNEVMYALGVDTVINNDLLMYSFRSFDSAFSVLAFGLITMLISLIVFGSVALIYNSFSISVSERTRQFGILKSIGATKKQIRKTVLYEAVILCAVGIPIGLISGCVGIAVTFRLLSDTIATFLSDLTDLKMSFVLSPYAILAASVISFITVVISAYIPARKAIRINPIESVRQSKEVRVRRRSVRVSPLTGKLFGFEATLSSKNFKRNKRKYRTTVFSLFMSVVLFISASSLAAYFTDIVEAESQDMNYDVSVDIYNMGNEYNPQYESEEFYTKLHNGLDGIKAIDEYTINKRMVTEYTIDIKYISDGYLGMMKDEYDESFTERESHSDLFNYNFIEDEAFRRILKQEGLDEKDYFNKEKPLALVYDMGTHIYQTGDKEKVYIVPFLDEKAFPDTLRITEVLSAFSEGEEIYYYFGNTEIIDGITYYVYDIGRDEGEEFDDATKRYLTESEAVTYIDINIGAFLREKPYFSLSNTNLIYPESMRNTVCPDEQWETHAFIIADDHEKAANDIKAFIRDMGGDVNTIKVYDYAAEIESIRALVTIATVLASGFIILISLIAAANVFNTISTNISLRRREIATLKSVGLTKKGLYKMMMFESLLYGVKSLAFSLPVSFIMTFIIYMIVDNSGYYLDFYVPWTNFIIAIISVFIIVIASMIYSIGKLKKDNTADTLRSENI